MKILILGSKGMVGHVVALYFQKKDHNVIRYKGCIHEVKIKEIVKNGRFDAVINCTAVINQYAELDKAEAVYVNSYLPHMIEQLTAETKTVLVHRSTDCVFSGKKGGYDLDDIPDAESFYARTKAIGEVINDKDITIRTSLIGPEQDEDGISLLNWFLKQQGNINGYANSIWTGLTTIEFARVIEFLLEHKAHGLFHTVPDHGIGKYDLLKLFAKYIPGDRNIVRVENKLVDKSLLQRIGDYGMVIPEYEEQIKNMVEWIRNNQSLYPKYYHIN